MLRLKPQKEYTFAHPESEYGLSFREGRSPRDYEFVGVHPAHGLLIFRRIPIWRRLLGER